jgi:ribonuclease J
MYIHSASEPYNEEQEFSQERIDAWLEHFGMHKFQSHCSGHARGQDLLDAVKEINAEKIFPIHTEHPEIYKNLVPKVTLVKEAMKYSL